MTWKMSIPESLKAYKLSYGIALDKEEQKRTPKTFLWVEETHCLVGIPKDDDGYLFICVT